MKWFSILFTIFFLSACNDNDTTTDTRADNNNSSTTDNGTNTVLSELTFPTTYQRSNKGELRVSETGYRYNPEAVIPPQCYTRHDEKYNPCMVCHQNYAYNSRPNSMNDGNLQAEYAFSDIGVTNHWQNLFEDRSDRVAAITDQDVINYIYTDNYTPLIEQLESGDDWTGPVPKVENLHKGAEAFDDLGFALDGSHWVAFNYKPMPGTFWPTNGSTDDVMIRLPESFRKQSCGSGVYSRDVYIANIAIVEMAIKDKQSITIPELDENNICADLNGDGVMGKVTIMNRPSHYVGDASSVEVETMLYPEGTEFLHTVRYVGINSDGSIGLSVRMKEVRYMKKNIFYSTTDLKNLYGNERQEKIDGLPPKYIHRGDEGTDNGFGWMVLGFIEAADGHLRQQSEEENLFCMGCHTTIGTTVDQTFAFPRKVDGANGWGFINIQGMSDAPVKGETEGGILNYFKVSGGGNEFRENDEIIKKWFMDDGTVNEIKVKNADVYELVKPDIERALTLNKAYMVIVKDQDFIHGRDATVTPVTNVYKTIDPDSTPTLPVDKRKSWDIRLDW